MSSLSEVDLARIVKQGNEEVKALGTNLSDDRSMGSCQRTCGLWRLKHTPLHPSLRLFLD